MKAKSRPPIIPRLENMAEKATVKKRYTRGEKHAKQVKQIAETPSSGYHSQRGPLSLSLPFR
jgi:hypothetical protein